MQLHRPSGRVGLGFALAALTMLLWGILPLALEAALGSLDPLTLTWFRFAMAALLLGAWLARGGALPRLAVLGRSGWLLLGVAILGLAANYIAYLLGLDRTSPANAQVLIQLAPLLLALGGLWLFHERFTRIQWLGFTMLVCGLGLFFGSQLRALAASADRYLSGVALLVLAAVTWAAYGLAQKQLLRSLPSQGIMVCVYAGCALCFWPGADPSRLLALGAAEWALVAFCGTNTLVAYGAFAAALDHWEASRVSAVLALTPLATLAFASLVERWASGWLAPEALTPASLLGAAGVVAGSLLTALGAGPVALSAGASDEGSVIEPG